jgi:hypothetical protein
MKDACSHCGQPIHLMDAPAGSWWAHDEHPVDEHDATPANYWRCLNCQGPTRISHQSTFCRVTGRSDVAVHWCCPDSCQLDYRLSEIAFTSWSGPDATTDTDLGGPPVTDPTPMTGTPDASLERGALKFWFHQGAVLQADERDSVSVADLLEFAQYAQKRHPQDRVQLHAYGLRVTSVTGTVGPKLEWRDWD